MECGTSVNHWRQGENSGTGNSVEVVEDRTMLLINNRAIHPSLDLEAFPGTI